jgi:hypothetical protein
VVAFAPNWERFGGLAIFGYPITDEFVDPTTGRVTQWFERARFEWHPGVFSERRDVLLGLLGRELTLGREKTAPFQPAQPIPGCTYFPETGHNLCGGFRAYWERFGGLAVYGFPISEEFREVNPDTGQTYLVQYFERQRFEWHPGEWPERFDVMLGRLGVQLLGQQPAPPPTSDARLVEFCAKAASEGYAAGAIIEPLQIRAWVLETLADSGEYIFRQKVDRYTEQVAQVNPYLAYSLFYTYRDGVPSDREILAWFPSFVRAFVTPNSPAVPPHMRLPYSYQDVVSFLNARLTTSGDLASEYLYRTCLRLARDNNAGQYIMFRGIVGYTELSPSIILSRLNVFASFYDDYVLLSRSGKLPRGMTFIEYITTYKDEILNFWFPGVDWERIRQEWAAERGAGAP